MLQVKVGNVGDMRVCGECLKVNPSLVEVTLHSEEVKESNEKEGCTFCHGS